MTVTIAKKATKNERIRVAVISQITKFIRTAGVFGFASALFPFCLGKDLLGILDIQVGEKNSTRNLTVLLSNLDFTIRLPFPPERELAPGKFSVFLNIFAVVHADEVPRVRTDRPFLYIWLFFVRIGRPGWKNWTTTGFLCVLFI